jgi:hypothetical protein
LGNCITLAALEGIESEDLQDYMERMGQRLRMEIQADPERAANKLSKAKDRYRFVGEEGGEPTFAASCANGSYAQ